MKALQDKILKEGIVKDGGVLKVDGFVNHRIDVAFMNEVGKEFKRLFDGVDINKIVTIEASGIGIACIVAQYFNAPVVFAKKNKSINISGDVYSVDVASFTHKTVNTIIMSKEYIGPDDKVLIVDDFLAKGNALKGLITLVRDAGAEVMGCGILIEKSFQEGRALIDSMGVRVESLARIKSMDNNELVFVEE